MTTSTAQQRARFRVRRAANGWLPIVLIGESPITLPAQPTKRDARRFAKTKLKEVHAQLHGPS